MAHVRGRVTTRLGDDEAWTIIDEISRKYTGQPYPLRTDRVVFLVGADHAPRQRVRVTGRGPEPATAWR